MAQLSHDYQKFVELNTEIIVVGPEDTKTFANWWYRHEMLFVGIADPKHVIANLYGQQVKLLKLGRMPAIILIDKNGRVRYKHHGESMSDIPENLEILSLLDRLKVEGISVE